MDAQTRRAIRGLCDAVTDLTVGSVHLLGTTRAGEIMEAIHALREDMTRLDKEEEDYAANC